MRLNSAYNISFMRHVEHPAVPPERQGAVEAFFGNPARVNQFVAGVMHEVGRKTYFTIRPTPESSYCKDVTPIAVQMLIDNEGIRAQVKRYTDYGRVNDLPLEHHAFPVILGEHGRIFDLQVPAICATRAARRSSTLYGYSK
jgi:hypothetical protein